MLHEPSGQSGRDAAASFKARMGLRLFCVYAAFYLLFVVINLVQPSLMEIVVVAGLNLAVVYGMVLIVSALVLAIGYDRACSREEKRHRHQPTGER